MFGLVALLALFTSATPIDPAARECVLGPTVGDLARAMASADLPGQVVRVETACAAPAAGRRACTTWFLSRYQHTESALRLDYVLSGVTVVAGTARCQRSG